MKHIRWQLLIALLGIAFLSAVLAFLAIGSTATERPDFGGTYIEGIAGRPSAINPIYSQYNDVDRDISSLVFTGLTRADESGVIKPDLAAHWSVSPDGLVYTFTLRSDVRWHDGVRFDAEDILYTIHTIQDPGYKGPPNLAAFWRTVAVTPVDEATVRFQLTQPYAPFLNYTTMGILPAHILRDVPPSELLSNPFNRRPVGTGPFRVAEVTGDSLSLDIHPNYYGTRPYLSRIQFKFYPDYESVFAAFNRGEVEGISRILPAYLPKARSMNNLSLYNAPLSGYSLVILNLSKPVFQDKTVRQALVYGTDRQRLIGEILQGQGIVSASPIDRNSWAYDSSLNPASFDVEKAKALLDNAGWKDAGPEGERRKGTTSLTFTLVTNDDPVRVAIANELAKEWQAIGIRATVQPVPASLLVQNVLRPRQFDAVLYEWRGISNDPDQYENWHETQVPNATNLGQNYSGLTDREMSEVLESARRTSDQAKRAELYRQFQERFADLTPGLLLFQPVYTYGVDTRVRGIQPAPMLASADRFRGVAQWYIKTKRVVSSMAPEEAPATSTVEIADLPAPRAALTAAPPTSAPLTAATAPAGPSALPPTPASTAGQCADAGGVISFPAMDGTVSGLIEIRGTASHANMAYWKLEYRADTTPNFKELYRSELPIVDGVLSLWSTRTAGSNGVYWLQLTVVDNTGNFGSPCLVRVNIGN